MTLAAAYRIGKVPALLTDTLVSGGTSPDHNPIATRVDLGEPLPLDWGVRVSGLVRKSVKVGVNAAVAGAGNGLAVSLILRELEAHFCGKTVSAASLQGYLEIVDDALSSVTACTLVGWLIEEGGPRSFQWESVTPQQIEWDGEYITGSGMTLFRNLAWTDRQKSWSAVDSFDHAQHYALTQISALLVNEISNGAPIQNLFGGGYDLLLWDGGQFRQAADVTFLFFSLEALRSPTRRETDPAPIIIRQAELEDCLVVRAILVNNQLGAKSAGGERVAVIAPVTHQGRQHQFQRPHPPSEVPYFADRIFVNITGTGPNETPQHWSGGVSGEQAKLFSLGPHSPGKMLFTFPIPILAQMCDVAEQHIAQRIIPPAE